MTERAARSTGLALVVACLAMQSARAQTDALPCQVHITSQPDGAAVEFDGRPRGTTPVTIQDAAPGKHLLVLTKRDHRTSRRTVTLTAGARTAEEFRLDPILGLVIIHSEPTGSDVQVDGVDRGQTPLLVTDLAIGQHRMRLGKPGYIAKEVELPILDATPRHEIHQLTPDFAVLRVESDPAGAALQVNGVMRGTTPVDIDRLPTGESTIQLELNGFEPYRDTLRLAAGENQTITATLKPIPSSLQIVSIPAGARIYVDNQFRGDAPVRLDGLLPGEYRVRAELPAHDLLLRTVAIGRASSVVEEFRLQSNSGAIEITTEPADVKVFIDGKESGATPIKEGQTDRVSSEALRIDTIPSGTREVRLTKPGFHEVAENVDILRDQTIVKHFRLARRFIPNCEVITTSEVYRGVLIEIDATGNVRLELMPGIMKTIPRQDIRTRRALREIDPDKEE